MQNQKYNMMESIQATTRSITRSTTEQYQQMHRRSIESSDEFWAEQAVEQLDWYKRWNTVKRRGGLSAQYIGARYLCLCNIDAGIGI
ncbi:MAG: hypothetical protein JKX81_13440 [Arenicella sp.]|nr:hypothetical protein [Arenicella sp.]